MAYTPTLQSMSPAPNRPSPMSGNGANPYETPDYLKQNAAAPGLGGGVSNMVKALMDGSNKFKSQQGGVGTPTGDGAWFGSSSVGGAPLAGQRGVAPMDSTASPVPTPSPRPMPGSPIGPEMSGTTMPSSGTPTQQSQNPTMTPFETGSQPFPFANGPSPGVISANGAESGVPGMPNGIDPTVNALFSQIPGSNPYGGVDNSYYSAGGAFNG